MGPTGRLGSRPSACHGLPSRDQSMPVLAPSGARQCYACPGVPRSPWSRGRSPLLGRGGARLSRGSRGVGRAVQAGRRRPGRGVFPLVPLQLHYPRRSRCRRPAARPAIPSNRWPRAFSGSRETCPGRPSTSSSGRRLPRGNRRPAPSPPGRSRTAPTRRPGTCRTSDTFRSGVNRVL